MSNDVCCCGRTRGVEGDEPLPYGTSPKPPNDTGNRPCGARAGYQPAPLGREGAGDTSPGATEALALRAALQSLAGRGTRSGDGRSAVPWDRRCCPQPQAWGCPRAAVLSCCGRSPNGITLGEHPAAGIRRCSDGPRPDFSGRKSISRAFRQGSRSRSARRYSAPRGRCRRDRRWWCRLRGRRRRRASGGGEPRRRPSRRCCRR